MVYFKLCRLFWGVVFCHQGVYDTSKHPDVIAGKCTEADVLEQFISTFEGEIKDGKVSKLLMWTGSCSEHLTLLTGSCFLAMNEGCVPV